MNWKYLITFILSLENWFSSREITLSTAIKEEGMEWSMSEFSQINIWKIVLAYMNTEYEMRGAGDHYLLIKESGVVVYIRQKEWLNLYFSKKHILPSKMAWTIHPRSWQVVPISHSWWTPKHSFKCIELIFLILWQNLQKILSNFLFISHTQINSKSVVCHDGSRSFVLFLLVISEKKISSWKTIK